MGCRSSAGSRTKPQRAGRAARHRALDRLSGRGQRRDDARAAPGVPRPLLEDQPPPGQVDAIGPSVEVDDIEGITVLGLNPLMLSRSSRFLKRSMDIVGATVGLLLFSPADRPGRRRGQAGLRGSVLFRQQRIGRQGRPLPPPQVPHHGPRGRAPGGGAVRAERGPQLAEARSRPPHHPSRQGPAPHQPRRAAPALERLEGGHEPGRPAPADRDRGRDGQRLGSHAAGPGARDHRPVAGAGPDQHPVRGDGQARLPVRDELVVVAGRQAPAPDVPRRGASARRRIRRQALACPLSGTHCERASATAAVTARTASSSRAGPIGNASPSSASRSAAGREPSRTYGLIAGCRWSAGV